MVSTILNPLDLLETQRVLTQPPASIKDESELTKNWMDLALRTQTARLSRKPLELNSALMAATERNSETPVAPAYLLWIADNQALAGNWEAALATYDAALKSAESTVALTPNINFGRVAMEYRAEAFAANGDVAAAISTWRELWASGAGHRTDAEGMLLAGILAEENSRDDEAAECYAQIADTAISHQYSPTQLALRASMRMDAPGHFEQSPAALRSALSDTLFDRDATALESMMSKTHFLVGVAGGHFRFEDETLRERFIAELIERDRKGTDVFLGTGDKRYMILNEWNGELLCGTAGLVFMRTPKGWECSGVLLSEVCEELQERWKPKDIQTNQPLPFTLRAPWPAGNSFMAGGLFDFGLRSAAVAAAGPTGVIVAHGFSLSDCGYGPRGFYYNDISDTHQDEHAFAIDFTRYRRGVPFDNESGGTAVLASAPGVVVTARGCRRSGHSNASNTVEIDHADPVSGITDRFRSRYLHLAGPNLLSVSVGMPVITGQRLGIMNDTGNSCLDHLHFSIHDQTVPSGNPQLGMSVRPTPMDGTTLGDSGSGKCVPSMNRERRPPPLDDAEFLRQSVPDRLKPNESGIASFSFRNNGPTTWTPGYRLISLQRGWTIDERPIGQTVLPDAEITIELPLVSLTPGNFDVQWQMARQFSGRFGQASRRQPVVVEQEDVDDVCTALRQALQSATFDLEIWQDELQTAPSPQKPLIIAQIRRIEGQINAIQAQMDSANC